MIHESSSSLLFESCHPDQVTLIRQVWTAAHAHGVKMTEQAHAWLDEPEYRITEQLKFPVLIKRPVESSKKRRLDNLELPPLVEKGKVIELYLRRKGYRVEAVNGL